MKARFIATRGRNRVVVRTNTIEVFSAIADNLQMLEMREVGPLRYWLHVFFWWKKKREHKGK